MALDSSLELLQWRGDNLSPLWLDESMAWRQLNYSNEDKFWAVSLKSRTWLTLDGRQIHEDTVADEWNKRFGEKWLVFAPGASKCLTQLVNILDYGLSNAYGLLESHGILIVDSGPKSLLAGGSFCETELLLESNRLIATKRINLTSFSGLPDADLKLRREDEFFRDLSHEAQSLFVTYLGSVETDEYFEYKTHFLHGYTLAENIFHGTMTVEAVLNSLQYVFAGLCDKLYGRPHTSGKWSCQENNILMRVTRRFNNILTSSDSIVDDWTALLTANEIQINGKIYAGWPQLFRWLSTSRHVMQALSVAYAEACHGDLILDDIVTPIDGKTIRLVDPNGDRSSRLYDVAKIYLSLLSFYEVFKYDRFSCRRKGLTIEIKIPDSPPIATLEAVGWALPSRLRQCGMWLGRISEPDGRALLLYNGLQNIALPMFHLLKHRAATRALAFFALGIIRLNQAYAEFNSRDNCVCEKIIEKYGQHHTL